MITTSHLIYQWCTLGGVERCIINRALALKAVGSLHRLSISFLHYNALRPFQEAVRKYDVEDYLTVMTNIPPADRYVLLDTPCWELIPDGKPVIVECHTTYPENQVYLKNLPRFVSGVICPSDHLRETIAPLVGPETRIMTVENYVHTTPNRGSLTAARDRPRTFFTFGRMDHWKNHTEALAIFGEVARRDPSSQFVISGNSVADAETLDYLEELKLLGRITLIPPMPFEAVSEFLRQRHSERAVFLSSSRGESFGLAAIEVMANGIPVVLSAVEGHQSIAPDTKSLYELGNISDGADKLMYISDHWAEQSESSIRTSRRFPDKNSVAKQWERAIEQMAPRRATRGLWDMDYGEMTASLEQSRHI